MATVSSSSAVQRNVVVVGKAGGGKSTIANRILGARAGKFAVNQVFTSTTTKVEARNCVLRKADGRSYSVKVIDTVGLFDTKRGEPGNKDIIKLAKEFFLNEAPEGVHLVLFVAKQGRWTEEEKKTFQFIRKHISDEISPISALIFTNCDSLSASKRQKILEEFKQDPDRAETAKFMGKGLHTVGFPDIESDPDMDEDMDLRDLLQKKAEKDQEVIRQLVYNSGEQLLSRDMILQDSFWRKLCPKLF